MVEVTMTRAWQEEIDEFVAKAVGRCHGEKAGDRPAPSEVVRAMWPTSRMSDEARDQLAQVGAIDLVNNAISGMRSDAADALLNGKSARPVRSGKYGHFVRKVLEITRMGAASQKLLMDFTEEDWMALKSRNASQRRGLRLMDAAADEAIRLIRKARVSTARELPQSDRDVIARLVATAKAVEDRE